MLSQVIRYVRLPEGEIHTVRQVRQREAINIVEKNQSQNPQKENAK